MDQCLIELQWFVFFFGFLMEHGEREWGRLGGSELEGDSIIELENCLSYISML